MCTMSLAPLGSAADWYSSLKNGSGYTSSKIHTPNYLYSGKEPLCMSVQLEERKKWGSSEAEIILLFFEMLPSAGVTTFGYSFMPDKLPDAT